MSDLEQAEEWVENRMKGQHRCGGAQIFTCDDAERMMEEAYLAGASQSQRWVKRTEDNAPQEGWYVCHSATLKEAWLDFYSEGTRFVTDLTDYIFIGELPIPAPEVKG